MPIFLLVPLGIIAPLIFVILGIYIIIQCVQDGDYSAIFIVLLMCILFPLAFSFGMINMFLDEKKFRLKEHLQKIGNILLGLSFFMLLVLMEVGGIYEIIKLLNGKSFADWAGALIFTFLPIPFFIIFGKMMISPLISYIKGPNKEYFDYINNNKVALGRFTRPVLNDKRKIVLANKYVILEFDITSFSIGEGQIVLTDKMHAKKYQITMFPNNPKKKTFSRMIDIFRDFCDIFNYEVVAENILCEVNKIRNNMNKKEKEMLYLDINQASEAELTALPGVTIAKAKRAIKMRKKYAFYLSVNQFYEAINLEEQFIEQITSNGTKILLNNLPEYKALEMKQEE